MTEDEIRAAVTKISAASHGGPEKDADEAMVQLTVFLFMSLTDLARDMHEIGAALRVLSHDTHDIAEAMRVIASTRVQQAHVDLRSS